MNVTRSISSFSFWLALLAGLATIPRGAGAQPCTCANDTAEARAHADEVFEGRVVDIGAKECTVELVGPERKIDTFLALMRPFGIKEMARTGRVALARGPKMEGHQENGS